MTQNIYKLLLFTFLITSSAFAQQDPTYTLYGYNMNIINPAYAGAKQETVLTSNIRSQWTNIPKSPETQSISFSTPLKDRIGIGASIVNDKVFVLKQTDAYIDFAYKLPIKDSLNVSLGLKAGGSFININLNTLGINNDPLFSENVSRFNPNVGVGAFLKGKKYYVTISAPVMLSSKRYEKTANVVTKASRKIHLYSGAGYELKLNDALLLKPSFMTRWVSGAPLTLDLNTTVNVEQFIDIGASLRVKESFSGLVFAKLASWLSLGYAYEHPIASVGKYSKGSHEIIFKFKL